MDFTGEAALSISETAFPATGNITGTINLLHPWLDPSFEVAGIAG